MNTVSKIIIAISASLAFSAAAYAYTHIGHNWKKVSEQEGINGQVVCQWQCGIGGPEVHYATTAGYGKCPYKW